MMRTTQERELSTLRDYFRLLLAHKLLMLVVFLLTTAAIVTAIYFLPPTYVARATLIIKIGREFIYQPEVGNPRDAPTFRLEEMVNSEVEILSSRDLAQQVIEEQSIGALFPEILQEDSDPARAMARAISAFQDSISVKSVVGSSIIKVSLEHGNPQVAAMALNLLIEKLKDKHLEIFSDSKPEFLEAQLAKYRQRLAESETALSSYREKNGLYKVPQNKELLDAERLRLTKELSDLDFQIADLKRQLKFLEKTRVVTNQHFPEQRKSLELELNQLTGNVRETEFKIVELERKLAHFKERQSQSSELVPPQPGMEDFRSLDHAFTRLLDLKLHQEELERNSTPGAGVVDLQKEIKKAEDFLREHGGHIGKLLEGAVVQDLSAQKGRKAAVEQQVVQVRSEIAALDEHEFTLRIQEIEGQIAPLETRRENIRQSIADLDQQLKKFDVQKERLRALERDVTLNEANFQTYLEKSEAALISAELDKQRITNVRVIEEATPPAAASGPSKKVKLAIGLLAGSVAAIAAALFAELLRQ
jgi:uncharacterized protein involved in exopolysaccharide biosynthesis